MRHDAQRLRRREGGRRHRDLRRARDSAGLSATQYALLLLPSANRVYADASAQLGVAELTVLLGTEVSVLELGGVCYLGFSAEQLSDVALEALSRASVSYALFALADDGAMRPVPLRSTNVFDDDLLTIQRYQGKTNEMFTKLLLNLTIANASLEGRRPVVLDPLAGRGTTLNHAAVLGWDSVGVEINKADVDAYRTFLTTWLKNKRLPHKAREDSVRLGGSKSARLTVTFGADRATFDQGEGTKLTAINGDARRVDEYLAKNVADVIVTDLPYGVRHGAHRSGGDRVRGPAELVAQCLPAWKAVLRANGAMGLAFNTHTMPRAELVEMLTASGLDVCDSAPYAQLAHRVDQSIHRDVVIARRRHLGTSGAVPRL